MAWNGGYRGANASTITGAKFQGSEPGGWLRYQLATPLQVPTVLAHKGFYGARVNIQQIGVQGSSVPTAGNYMCDFEIVSEVVFSQPFYVAAGTINWNTDPYGRTAGYSRVELILRMRPTMVPDALTSVAILSLNYEIYRIT